MAFLSLYDMTESIEHKINEKFHILDKFCLQLDETTDVSGKMELISFARFVVQAHIIRQPLCGGN
jgi:hypothetical protein